METIRKTYSIEGIISRVCGLFPYVTYVDGVRELHSAYDSENGCYGKIVPKLKPPVDFIYDGKTLVRKNEPYTYGYLMSLYYEYKEESHDDEFINFIRDGIGLYEVDKKSIGLDDIEKYPLVPDEIMLATLPLLVSDMERLKKSCDTYVKTKECESCLDCEKYNKMGGDVFLEYMNSLDRERSVLCTAFYNIASQDDMCVGFDIPLYQSGRDMGYMEAYTNEWVAGERYYCGDIVTYNGTTYVCVLNHVVPNPCGQYTNLCEYTLCNDRIYSLNYNGTDYDEYELHHVCSLTLAEHCGLDYDFIECNGHYYIHTSDGYEEISVCEYTTGVFDEETGIYEFDYAHFMPMTDFVSSYGSNDNVPDSDEVGGWYCANNVYGSKYKIFRELSVVPDTYECDFVRVNGTIYVWDTTSEMYVPDLNDGTLYKIEGQADSMLKSIRYNDEFIGNDQRVHEPAFGEDYLYYYKVGIVKNIDISYDEGTGNIMRTSNSVLYPGVVANDLYAYGDVLYDIQVDSSKREITFYYVLGAHLKAKCRGLDFDELLRPLYRFDNEFIYDEDDAHGVRYYETYVYDEGSELDELVTKGEFEKYVNSYEDYILYDEQEYAFIDVENDVLSVILSDNNPSLPTPSKKYIVVQNGENETIFGDFYKLENGQYVPYSYIRISNYTSVRFSFHCKEGDDTNVNTVKFMYKSKVYEWTYIRSDYEETVVNNLDLLYTPLYKKNYMVGIHYNPDINESVYVGRGNAASIERHLALGSVKTLSDMEDYRNGGFFNLMEV